MSKSFTPKVSIIIPVYNGSNYVKEAIDSALSQTYKNIEVVVINDGSTDGGKTDKICKSYGNKIRYYLKENGGVATALNMGIEKMKGEYFSWLSHDDVYYPNKVEQQIEVLSGLEDKETILYSNYEIIGPEGELLVRRDFGESHKIEDLNKNLYPFFHLLLNGCTMLIPKSHFSSVGIFNEALPTTQDYDLFFRLLRNKDIFYIEDFLIKSRSHPNQGSKAFIDTHVEECNEFWIGVFNRITDEEKIYLEGSIYAFYSSLFTSFTENTGYDRTKNFLYSKMVESLREETLSSSKRLLENRFKKLSDLNHISEERVRELFYLKKKSKPRIVFFTANWHDRGGLNRVLATVSPMLSEEYEVILCCVKEDGNETGYELGEKVKFLEIEESEFSLIPEILTLIDADIFIGSNNCFVPLVSMYPKIEEMGVKVIMWNHEHYFVPHYDDRIYVNSIIFHREEIFDKVSVVLWLTKFNAKIGRIFAQRVGIMRNPLGLELKSKVGNKKHNYNLVSIARFDSPRKRIDRLLKVFSLVLKGVPKAKLLVVGKYDLEMLVPGSNTQTIAELINSLSIPTSSLEFVGEVKDVSEYYEKSAVNLLTSEREGFGLTIIEAALFGLPTAVFAEGGMRDIVSDGVNGFAVEGNDINEMANRIIQVLKDEKLYSKISNSARLMADEYHKETVKKNWIKLIDAVLELERDELEDYLNKNFAYGSDEPFSTVEMNDVFKMYEGSVREKLTDISLKDLELSRLSHIEESLSWRITKPLRVVRKGFLLVKKQGVLVTFRNVLLKIKTRFRE